MTTKTRAKSGSRAPMMMSATSPATSMRVNATFVQLASFTPTTFNATAASTSPVAIIHEGNVTNEDAYPANARATVVAVATAAATSAHPSVPGSHAAVGHAVRA